jgi:hypothetical protein
LTNGAYAGARHASSISRRTYKSTGPQLYQESSSTSAAVTRAKPSPIVCGPPIDMFSRSSHIATGATLSTTFASQYFSVTLPQASVTM